MYQNYPLALSFVSYNFYCHSYLQLKTSFNIVEERFKQLLNFDVSAV